MEARMKVEKIRKVKKIQREQRRDELILEKICFGIVGLQPALRLYEFQPCSS
jgi:hypothetical protein